MEVDTALLPGKHKDSLFLSCSTAGSRVCPPRGCLRRRDENLSFGVSKGEGGSKNISEAEEAGRPLREGGSGVVILRSNTAVRPA